MGKLIHLCLGIALIPIVHAQSAANFDTKVLTPDGVEKKEDKAAPPAAAPKEPGPAPTTPSRYVGPPDLESYLGAQASIFLSRGRTRDPFGQMQDPDAKPIVKATSSKPTRRVAPVQATPFSEIVRLINVNAVMAREQKFLIGNREVKTGEVLPLNFRGKTLRAEVTRVSAQSITFRNLDTNDTAVRTLDVLPVGMTPGGKGGITAPGMVRDGGDAPILLEANEPMSPPP